jgi:phosphoribosyl-ATP pyrophosphohydrolase
MQQHTQTIIQQFFKKDNLSQVTEEELQTLIDKYPYMGIGHWLKAKQSAEDGTADALSASLYTNNPSWLYFSIISEFDAPVATTTTSVVAEQAAEEVKPTIAAVIEEPAETAVQAEQVAEVSLKTEEQSLVFEPYHTIDYFASQGIKLQTEDYKDKLGKQLKSFTEWLRDMKRIQPKEQVEVLEIRNPAPREDSNKSVTPPEIITETMAEVWVKQGNKLKAIAIYEKLSLLNPNKNHYFAKKIEQLKGA